MTKRNTLRRRGRNRITNDLEVVRNTKAARASAQLTAFPASQNQRERQHPRLRSVVSLRLKGDTINALDVEAERITKDEGGPKRYRRGVGWKATRTDVIERALELYFEQPNKER